MIHTERQRVSLFLVVHPDGIHIRPAHALTLLAQELYREQRIVTSVRNPAVSKEPRNVVLEFDQARSGYGNLYGTFTEQMFLPESQIEITLKGPAEACKINRALEVYERLLGDAEMLEAGGVLPRFQSEYVDAVKGLK
jgi:hypothetical protein